MKSRDEMVNSLFERRAQYQAEQKRKRNTLVKAVIPAFCVCLALVLGVGIWQSNTPDYIGDTPSKSDAATSTPSEDAPESNNEAADMIDSIEVNGATYVQCSSVTQMHTPDKYLVVSADNVTQTYTPDKYLGVAADFDGTYQMDPDVKIFTVTEDSDMLLVKLQNGDCIFLAKEENE